MITTTYSVTDIRTEFRANVDTSSFKTLSNIVAIAGGGFAVVYASDNGSNDRPLLDIYDSAADTTPISVIPFDESNVDLRGEPVMTRLANGNLAVVWKEGPDGDNAVLASMVNPLTGAVPLKELSVTSSPTNEDPEVAALANGNFVVTVADSAAGGVNAFVRSPTGGVVADVAVEAGATDPAVAGLTGGRFVVTYVDGGDINARLYEADGTAVAGVGEIEVGLSASTAPQIAALKNGGFAIVYVDDDFGVDQDKDIALMIFDGSGNPVVPGPINADGSAGSTASLPKTDPEITVLDNGYILVTWTVTWNAFDRDIFARVFDPAGNVIPANGGGDYFIVDGTGFPIDGTQSSIAALLSGQFVTSWTHDEYVDLGGGVPGEQTRGEISARVQELTRTISGDSAANTLTGDELRDIITGGGGDDTVNGGGGSDTAVYSGTRANYNIVRLSTGEVSVSDTRGGNPDGFDKVTNVEQFRFSDGDKSLAQVIDITDFNVFWHQTSTNDWRDWTLSGGAVTANLDFASFPEWDLKATGDFNADGIGDSLWRNTTTGQVRTIEHSSSGVISVNVITTLATGWAPIGTGDFNGDATSDVIWENANTGELRNWSMQDGVIANNTSLGVLPAEWQLVATGDFNGDGTHDMFFRSTATGAMREWLMSNGALASNLIFTGPTSNWAIAATGDFNHDNTTDIIWRDSATGEARLWLMANGAVANNIIMQSPLPQWKLIAVGDYDQNGHDDLLWQNSSTGDVREWLMTNGTLNSSVVIAGGAPIDFTTAVNASTHTDFLPSI